MSRQSPSTDPNEVRNVTFLSRELFTCEVLADLDAAAVAAGGDETEGHDKENEGEEGRDPILELEAANRANTEEIVKLRELAKDGFPGYSADNRGLLCISDKVYVPEDPPMLAALLIRHIQEQPSTGHPGRNCMVCLLSACFHLKNLAQRVAKYLKNHQCAVSWLGTPAHLRSSSPCQSQMPLGVISELISSAPCQCRTDII